MIQWLANFGYIIAGILFLPIVIYRMIFQKRYLRGWKNRLGFVPKRYGQRPAIWIHAVSLGETNAAKPLIERLRQQLPFHEIFVSTTTDTGYDRASKLYGSENVFFFPFDFSCTMSKAMKRLNPSLVVLMELEVWPNLATIANRLKIPVVIANGRLTKRSLDRYKLLGPLAKGIFGSLTIIMVQDEIYRKRFLNLGIESSKLLVTGSLKWDGASLAEKISGVQELSEALRIDPNKKLLVAGSTGDDLEEEAIIRSYQQLRTQHNDLQLAVIPRKPERFDSVAKILSSRGFHVIRRTKYPDGTLAPDGPVAGKPTVILGDTMGELRKFYSLASVIFVGRTLVPMGGSDVMEVAALSKPMIIGPHFEHFKDAVNKLLEADAITIAEQPEKLAGIIEKLLTDEGARNILAKNAKNVVIENQGATRKTVERLCDILEMEYDKTERGIATEKIASALQGQPTAGSQN